DGQYMSGERTEVIGDRLLVPDVRQDLVKDRYRRLICRYRNSGLRHQREQADRFQHNSLAAGIWAADHKKAPRLVQVKRHWRDRTILAPQIVFQEGMARFDQAQ